MRKKWKNFLKGITKNHLIYRRFKDVLKKYRREFMRVLFLSLIISLIHLLLPLQLRQLLFGVQNNASPAETSVRLVMILLIMFWATVANIYFYINTDRFGGKYLTDLLCSAEDRIEKCRFSEVEKIGAERIKHILYADSLEMFRIIGNFFPQLVCAFIVTLFSLLLSVVFRPLLSLFLLISFFVGVGISFYSRNRIYHAASKTNVLLKNVSDVLNTYVDSIATVKSNHWTGHYQRETEKAVSGFIADSVREDREIYFFQGIISNYNILIQILISLILSLPMYENSIIDLAFYMVLFSVIMRQGESMELLLQRIHRGTVSFYNMDEILSLPEVFGEKELTSISEIQVKELLFKYPGFEKAVFENFNFSAKPGDSVRICGGNGRGKSTLLKLFLRFYAAQEGKIFFNGCPIDEYCSDSFYRQVLYIGQDELLINGSIENYLKLVSGQDEVSQDVVLSEVQIGDVHEEIRNLGKNLSGGQRKKLLFAKMKIRAERASLILVDELDSAFDVDTKQALEEWLNEQITRGDKIIFVVSHNDSGGIRFNRSIDL